MKLSQTGIVLLSGLVLGGLGMVTLDNSDVYAKQENGYSVHTGYDKPWGSQLAKEGYVFRLENDQNNNGLWSQPIGKNGHNLISRKAFQQVIKNKVDFKIYRVWQYKNGLQYKIVSRSGKYRGWIDNAGVYNKYSLDKQLQPIIEQEQKVVNSINSKYPYTTHYNKADLMDYRNDLAKANKEASGLSGNKRAIALSSVKEVNRYLRSHNADLVPTLLWQKVK
ncbi:hypothetical protein [Lentilactobacillus diolivorans]|uniref:Uncharacterized protein n=2 Tax=Lentilactobacillus diolivorans TaxID=179838 RepID=A0A0R1S507_9LACO|nr:hypothetical protein [Lentilactobacillus diolivorans]KRL64087.1 hypothetical protein FC85_GL001355 [Lentilactobacillus diolivorans DSM 14421]GEP23569.1 hypothetical protein LDI01_11620 [Lentilactobacillus diolivorans]